MPATVGETRATAVSLSDLFPLAELTAAIEAGHVKWHIRGDGQLKQRVRSARRPELPGAEVAP